MAITKWSIQAPSPKKSVAYVILCIIARASMIWLGLAWLACGVVLSWKSVLQFFWWEKMGVENCKSEEIQKHGGEHTPPSAHNQTRREPHQHSGEQHTNNNGKNDLPLAHTQEV